MKHLLAFLVDNPPVTSHVTLDISGSLIDFQWGSRNILGNLDRYEVCVLM